MSYNFS